MTATVAQGTTSRAGWIKVWDPFVRVAHWTVTIGFFVAYATEEPLALHVWAGYVVGVVTVARILWGFVGTRHARFTDFVTWPWQGLAYLLSLFSGRAARHLGHSPAGGLMVEALLAMLLAITVSGLGLYAVRNGAGPLSPFIAQAQIVSAPQRPAEGAAVAPRSGGETRRSPEVRAWLEAHEVLANATLLLVILHVAGVVLASLVHRENLVASMVHGRKRP